MDGVEFKVPLSIRSMEIWERIEELVDDACGFESHGQVLVAENDAEFDACRARVTELNALGFTREELIDGPELRRLVPAVAESCPGGVVSRRDGAADPARTTTAFRRKAAALGATVREGVAATNIRKARRAVAGGCRRRLLCGAGARQCRRRLGQPHRR